MPVPVRASHEEAARAAEFNEKKWVWVPDEKEGYLAGWVVQEEQDEDMGEVVLAAGGEHRTLPLYMLSKMNPPKFDRVDDIADLTYLNEASVVHNLRLRYGSNAIYTYSGLFLVAINPYQTLPLYTDAIIDQYRHRRRDEVPPHIFAIAERAWVHMNEERECQSVLITGESGAGKTENTKKVIQYLASIASEAHAAPSTPTHSRTASAVSPHSPIPRSHSSKSSIASLGLSAVPTTPRASAVKSRSRGLGLLERQILQANPILEAFGNAQTLRNNNSSRFGKFVRISFSSDSSISGAEIDWYLLEKSRVTFRHEGERSFHVFYQLLEGGGALLDTLLLEGGPEHYEYLNKGRTFVDGVNDSEEFRQLKIALDIVGFTNNEQLDLFRIIAAILHIGNLTMISTRSVEQTAFTPESQPLLEKICWLLGLPPLEFEKAVLRPRTKAGREWVTQQRTADQVKDELASLSKILYERCFGSLVERINKALDRPSAKSTFIGVLDIAGFEIFETNSFEQLCINYTNEKLQQFFNHHMFVLEQEEYSRESIEWDFVNFGLDLQPTIDLIESRDPIGILSCLDEECIMPKATDITFTSKVHALWAEVGHPGSEKYAPTRFEQGFVIQHYAGKVEYRTDGWLQKNKDPLNDNLTRLLSTSSEKYIGGLFAEYAEDATATPVGKKRVKKGAFRTVGQRHKEQLSQLMNQLQATQPHFVRCIVPNSLKKPGKLDVPLVLDQLRCNGVLEGIRIARLGYPNRLPFAEFRQRYEVLTPGVIPRGYMDGRKASARMIEALELDPAIYKLGTSKVFFKAGVLAELEEKRDTHLFDIFSRFQAGARMFTARRQMRKILNRANAIRTIQRNARVYIELREWPWWQLYTKVRPMLAATRNDEEIRKKDAELAAIRERAEKEKRENAALEATILQLQAEKKKVEDELESERQLGLDKDQQLTRSKARECDLGDDVAALQIDFDNLEAELARVTEAKKTSDNNLETLALAHEDAKIRLAAYEEQQREWRKKEGKLVEDLRKRSSDCSTLEKRRDELEKIVHDHETALLARENDVTRLKERIKSHESELKDEAVSLQNELDGLRTELTRANDSKKASDTKLETLSLQHEDAKIRLASIEEQHRQLKKTESRLKEDLRKRSSECTILEKRKSELEKLVDEQQAALLAKEEGTAHLEETIRERESMLRDEVDSLQKDLNAVKGQLVRATNAKTTAEGNLETLLLQHEDAKIRLAALEEQQREWKKKEGRLMDDVRKRTSECTSIAKRRDELENIVSQQEAALVAREGEVARLKEHMDKAAADMEKKLSAEIQTRDAGKLKAEMLEREAVQAKENLAKLKRMSTDYEARIRKGEANVDLLTKELAASKLDAQASTKKVEELQGQLTSLRKELDAQKGDRHKDSLLRGKLQAELDQLRKSLDTKTMEDRKRSEVDRTKEHERSELQLQVGQLEGQLADIRRQAQKERTKLELDLDSAKRELTVATKTCNDLQQQAKAHTQNLREAELAVIQAEKQKRAAQSELEALRNKHGDADGQLAQMTKTKESLERRLADAHAKHQDFEDAVLQIEREKASWARQMESVRKQLSAETTRREKLEKTIAARDHEIAQFSDRQVNWEKELTKARSDLAAREQEIGQLRGRPADITIIEHVHVLEEAKRVTDRQLLEAQAELESLQLYVRSLERAKQRPQSLSDQQMQILSQQSQIRELRAVLEEAESDRIALQRARRNLESRLEEIEQAQFRLPDRAVHARAAVV